MKTRRTRAITLVIAVVSGVAVLTACAGIPSEDARANPTLPPTEIAQSVPSSKATPAIAARSSETPTPFITGPAVNQTAILPILMYHHLADLSANASELDLTWTVAPGNFTAQIDWLGRNGYQTITMTQVVMHLKERKPLPRKTIILSFDDGWVEGYTVAFPVLQRYNFTGVYYVYTQPLGKSKYLTWAHLKEMAAAGMEFQAHTLTHPHLRTLPPDAALKEIADSKSLLEKQLGKPVTSFAYPFGEYNVAIVELVKRAGFHSAVTIAPGYRQRADELYTLHRIRVSYRETLADFVAHLPPE